MASQLQVQESSATAVKRHTLTEASSVLLDVVRFGAAIVVLVGHITVPVFRTSFPDWHIIGECAVPVFFVLSGFVIRFVTRSREHTLRDFYIDRASRMYSVILPAMALTLVLAGVCVLIDRPYYMQVWGPFSDHIFFRVLINLTFLSQSWGRTTIPLIDGPFWSLSYECMYYVAYGLIFYLRGGRRIAAVLVWALIAGPQVLFLFPVWYLGCWIYDLYIAIRNSAAARGLRIATLAYLVAALGLAAFGKSILLRLPFRFIGAFARLPNILDILHIPTIRATMFTFGIGLVTAVAMFLALLLSDLVPLPRKNVWARRFRHLADGTFSIYLLHYPLLVFATIVGLLRPHASTLNVATGVVIGVLLIVVARPLDLLKVAMRTQLRRTLPGPS